jgi:hypothetical protein
MSGTRALPVRKEFRVFPQAASQPKQNGTITDSRPDSFWHNLLISWKHHARMSSREVRLTHLFRSLVTPQGYRRICAMAVLVLIGAVRMRAAESPTITFSLDFPASDPEHYSIAVTADGQAHYECTAKISADSDDRENYQWEFAFSDATRTRIFDLAAQAHYFSGKVDSGNRKLAFTGKKKLVYNDGQHNNSAEYNFSSMAQVQQLTALFQSVAATLDFGRRLVYAHRYQKLALDDELKQMEDSARKGEITELQSVKPILQQIYDDSSVLNVVRARAQRLMEMGNGPASGR